MQENFSRSLTFTLAYEGGYVDNPRDPGGPTNRGITIATLSHELGRQATRTDVRNLTIQQAGSIYQKKYWNAVGSDSKPAGVDLMLFDIGVNMGVGRALRFNDETGSLAPKDRIVALDRLRMGFWRHLRTWPIFGKGWSRRENACLALARQMASAA
jgi:lysozyme family protein